MNRAELIEVQQQAAAALEAGQKLAARAAARRTGGNMPERPGGAALGALLANPGAFWSGAAVCESFGDGEAVEPLALATRYAAARLAAGDFGFVRETLIGQANWAGVLAVKLAQRAENEAKPDNAMPWLKMALQAQRQAAAALCSAAALNKLADAEAVTVVGGG